jgi:hypothetical protein
MDMRLFDKRVVRRNLDKELIGTKDFANYIRNLPDLEDEYQSISIDASKESTKEDANDSTGDEAE